MIRAGVALYPVFNQEAYLRHNHCIRQRFIPAGSSLHFLALKINLY